MGGYEAGYYSYLWSEVIAMDLFSEFEKNGILNYETGKKYIDLILSPGGSLDELSQVKKFLGRDISNDAFLSSIGVKLKENTNVS
jgi:Zn-dependent oligopeptidase